MSDSQSDIDSKHSTFPFEEGDTVCIRARDGARGTLIGKVSGECTKIRTNGKMVSEMATFSLCFGRGLISLRPYDAEFEVVDDPTDVPF